MRLQTARRSGFTLLEVLLASALAVVLMAALYVALDVQLRLASTGRDLVEEATLERAVTQRIERDLVMVLGPVAPPVTTASTTTTSGAGASGTGASDPVISDATSTTDTIPFQAGVMGDSTVLTVFVSRATKTDSGLADIRRITYWVTDRGLSRQEIPNVTSEQVASSQEPVIEQGKDAVDYAIAEEITQVQFEYWDTAAGAWTDTWDGSTLGPDGKTPQGPPAAIRVHFWVTIPGQKETREIRHTIPIRAASGPATTAADQASGTTTP